MSYDTLREAQWDMPGFLESVGCPADDLCQSQPPTSEGRDDESACKWRLGRFQKLQREAGIPKRYRYARLATCPKAVRDYAFECRRGIRSDSGCRWLMLSGSPGTGKSYASAAVASDLIDLGARYTNFSAMLSDIRDTYNNRKGASSERGIIDDLCTVPVLVINDFGKDSIGSQWALSIMFQILNRRYEEMMATVISTQLKSGELYAYLDLDGTGAFAEAMLSRLSEAVFVSTDGTDRRLSAWRPSTLPAPSHEVSSDELAACDSLYAQKLEEGLEGADGHLRAFGWRAAVDSGGTDDMRRDRALPKEGDR